ncbi:MAG: bifunctional phosphoribosyl-AMP cyclohydrolase/phosphoribosyl-ATP diphosphatase HisIE [Candidatus Methylomirabilia bacterium]
MAEELRFDAQGLIPAVVQEATTGEVLMVAWMDREALEVTRKTGLAHFWSRSRQALWKKGGTSGHIQHVDAIYADCDRDVLLLLVHQEGVACHTGSRTCFFSRLNGRGTLPDRWDGPEILELVERVIQSRKADPRPDSYVSGLLAGGESAVCRKVGEEAIEVVAAALGGESESRLLSEVADLWFHTLILLGGRGIPLRRLFAELARRHRERPARSRGSES